MNYSKTLLTATVYTCMALYGANTVAAAQTKATYGDIIFYNSKGEQKCTLSVPETRQTFDFSQSSQSCENNMAVTFTLRNIPSATLIQFYDEEICSDAKVSDNFFVKLKTVKQPTDWSNPAANMTLNDFKKRQAGDLIPNKNIRVEEQWEGSDYANKDWNERLSCVYIERSQPAN
ncbi:hypothetical protein [Pseudomonas sp. PB3P13]